MFAAHLAIRLLSIAAIAYALPLRAQILPDGTLPVNSIVVPNGDRFVIEGGTPAGANLFHSFSEFSVPTGSEAFFNNAASTENILTRVTGGNISNIDGLIRANGSANLFLLNPNGIVLGANARLNIGGSFVGSSAESLLFEGGLEFSASDPTGATGSSPLLLISVPTGLQWNSQNRGSIRVEGTGNPDVFPSNEIGLSGSPGQTIALVGGDVTFSGAAIAAPDGRIEVGSVSSGRVKLAAIDGGWHLDYSQVPEFGTIELLSQSSLFVPTLEGNLNGKIRVVGNNIRLLDRSQIASVNQGNYAGSPIDIRAVESLEIGGADESAFPFSSWIVTQVREEANGDGGDIRISAPYLSVRDGGRIETASWGQGDGGNIAIDSESVAVRGFSPLTSTVLSAENLNSRIGSDTYGAGNGGAIEISTAELALLEWGQIESDVEPTATGKGGNIRIEASSIEIAGVVPLQDTPEEDIFSGISSRTFGAGDGGSISLRSDRLAVADGGQVVTVVLVPELEEPIERIGSGNAGNITVDARDSIEISGTNIIPGFVSLIGSITFGSGDAGDISASTERLTLKAGGALSSNVSFASAITGEPLPGAGEGNGGNLTVNAGSIEISGLESAGIVGSFLGTFTSAIGDSGDTVVNARRLVVRDGGGLSSGTIASGNAGSITIDASESIEIVGRDSQTSRFAQISAAAFAAGEDARELFFVPPVPTGNTGAVTISTERLTVRDGALLSVSHFGTGNAGELNVSASEILLDNGGFISASTAAGLGGNMTLKAGSLQLRRGSGITVEAFGDLGDGGNLTINTDTLAALEDSKIAANAVTGAGGNIRINTRSLFLSADSEITASSQFGVDGVVEINNPEIDSTQGLVELPEHPINDSNLLVTGCVAAGGNYFTVTGRGGLPPNPEEQIISDRPWADLRDLSAFRGEVGKNISPESAGYVEGAIVEANSWRTNEQGEIELVAVVEASAPAVSSLPPNCALSELGSRKMELISDD